MKDERRYFRNFESEDELTEKYRARSMSFSPIQSKEEDDWIAAQMFRVLMGCLDPITRMLMTQHMKMNIKATCNRSSEFTEGVYNVNIMNFEDLRYALENSDCIIVGCPSKTSVFAAIDDSARIICFYIPKSRRQMEIQNAINDAIWNFEKRLEKKGVHPRKDVSEALEEFLWMQTYPKQIPHIRIYGVPNRLPVDRQTASCRLEGSTNYIQMRYNPLYNVVHYHIE